MLHRLIRYLVTSTVLLTMAVAGLPVFVCVSQAHGAMIEFGGTHLDKNEANASHHTLFVHVEDSAQFVHVEDSAHSDPCVDFRLERGTIVQESRSHQQSSNFDAIDSTPPYAVTLPSRLESGTTGFVYQAAPPDISPTLRERRTIVLRI
ncbi:hypothetical protein [Hyphomicrobium sp.]|uniref:hypothetical protein n=1 Tax=Hyphomicrobium sp. TaxID=82 RepID=UPI002D782AED|nr:hypothetical protein [Hyphomicrobium sp.]HET6387762.1 hypothetical protein [Hyphomicrobium sp.]